MRKNLLLFSIFSFFYVVSLAVYSSNLQGPFVYDDIWQIIDNPLVQKQDISKISHYNKRIVTNFSFYINSLLSNFENKDILTSTGGRSTVVWHLTNIFLHTVCSFTFLLLLHYFFPDTSLWISTCFALLFLVHPLNSEAVNYIQARAVILMVIFIFFAILLWAKNKWGISLLFSIFATLSKEVAIFYVVILVLLHNSYHKKLKLNRQTILFLITFAIFLGIFSTAILQRYNSANIWENVLSQVWAYYYYIYLYFLPFANHLSFDHPYNPISYSHFFLILLLSITCVVTYKRTAFRYLFFVSMAILLPYALIPTAFTVVEYRAYPMVAIFTFLLFFSLKRLTTVTTSNSAKRLLLYTCTAMILFFCSYQTYSRNFVWRTSPQLYFDAVKKGSLRSGIHINLAMSYVVMGQVLWNHDNHLAMSYFALAENKIQELLLSLNIAKDKNLMLKIQLLKIYEAYQDHQKVLNFIAQIKEEVKETNYRNLVLLSEATAYYHTHKIKQCREILDSIEINDLPPELKAYFIDLRQKVKRN